MPLCVATHSYPSSSILARSNHFVEVGGGAQKGKKNEEEGEKKWTICCFRCAANPLIEPLMLFKLATGAKLLMKF